MGKSGKGLGIFALIIAIGALGLSAYQFILPSPSEGSDIYSETNNDTVYLGYDTFEIIPNLNLTYTTKTGDSVLLEFSCQVSIEISGASTTVEITFEIDGLAPSPDTKVSVVGFGPDPYLQNPFIMRHYIQTSSAGTHVVSVLTDIDDGSTTSFVKYCVLTATVY